MVALEANTIPAAYRGPQRFDPEPAGGERARAERQITSAHEIDDAILCAACRYRVTSDRERIAVVGRHEHHVTNPGGFHFRIGCFRHAPGCAVWGPPTLGYTWFAGFAWEHSLCRGCGSHLGWHFVNREAVGFFGLVLNRLVQEASARE
jgi:hypothetical protein